MRIVGRRLPPVPLSTFERIYRDHVHQVRWVVRARGVPESAMDDVVHDAFLSMYRRLPKRDPQVPLEAWVRGVARSVAFSHRRAAARRLERHAGAGAPPQPSTPHEQLERGRAWAALSSFIESLPAAQREVFVLAEVSGLSVAEIAQTTDVSLNTLYSRLRLARRRFAERFAERSEPQAGQRLIREARRQARPPATEQRRTWGLLVAKIGATPLAAAPVAAGSVATSAPAMSGWTGAVLGIVGALGLGIAWRWGGAPARAPTAVTSSAVHPGSSASPEPGGRHVAPGVARAEAPAAVVPPDRSAPSPPAPVPARIDHPSPLRQAPPRSAPSMGEPAGPPIVQTPAPGPVKAPDGLDAELAVLRDARVALSHGRGHDALRLVDTHRERFSNSALIRERHTIERDAACLVGQGPRARAASMALGGDASPCSPSADSSTPR